MGLILTPVQILARGAQFSFSLALLVATILYLVDLTKNDLEVALWIKGTIALAVGGLVWSFLAFIFICCLGKLKILRVTGTTIDLILASGNVAVAVILYWTSPNNCLNYTSVESVVLSGYEVGLDYFTEGTACTYHRVDFSAALSLW